MYYFNIEIISYLHIKYPVFFKSFELVYDDWNMYNDKTYYFK